LPLSQTAAAPTDEIEAEIKIEKKEEKNILTTDQDSLVETNLN